MNKLAIVMFLWILFMIGSDYYCHKEAFDAKSTAEVVVLGTSCESRRGDNIQISDKGEKAWMEVDRPTCSGLQPGEYLTVLHSHRSDKYYQNKAPSQRSLYLFPFGIAFIVYLVWLDIKVNRGKS